MTTAHKQLYCSTVNPKYGVPCSYAAKHPEVVKRKMERQKKTDSPYYLLWRKRNDLIRKNKSLGKYDEKKTLREASLLLGLTEDGAQSKLKKILEKLKRSLQD